MRAAPSPERAGSRRASPPADAAAGARSPEGLSAMSVAPSPERAGSLPASHPLTLTLRARRASPPAAATAAAAAAAAAHSPQSVTVRFGGLSVDVRSPKRAPAASPPLPPLASAEVAALAARCAAAARALAAAGEPADAAFFERWLFARGPALDAAAAAVEQHAAWRAAFVGAGGVAAAAIAGELAARKVALQGASASGRPLLVFRARRHRAGAAPLDDTVRLLVFALDAARAAAPPPGRVDVVFALSGLAAANLDVGLLRGLLELLQTHYPETLGRLYFADAPLVFWAAWRLVKPFVAEGTRGKIEFVSGARGRAQLLEELGAAALPRELGGEAELRPVGGTAAGAEAGEPLAAGGGALRRAAGAAAARLRAAPAVAAALALLVAVQALLLGLLQALFAAAARGARLLLRAPVEAAAAAKSAPAAPVAAAAPATPPPEPATPTPGAALSVQF
jgi:hypothetical protein